MVRYHHRMSDNVRVDEVARRRSWLLAPAMVCIALYAPAVIAQRRAAGVPSGPTVPLTIALKVGGDAYRLTGQGKCQHAAQASIYDVPAEQWSVQHSEGARNLSLTMWRPKKGTGDMLTLAVTTGARSYGVNTVKADQSAPARGSGTISVAPAGKGGTFTIDAVTPEGAPITGTITCEAFTAPMPEGGD